MALSVVEIFESIQGETSLAGCMTSFIRLAGCSLRCAWCDSTFSFSGGVARSIEDIMGHVEKLGWPHVCVTGGEPLLQAEVYQLLNALLQKQHIVSLETNGAHSISLVPGGVRTILDLKCPSSQMTDKMIWENLALLKPHDEVKFVIANRRDYDWAKEKFLANPALGKAGNILFSAAFGQLDAKELIGWILQDKLPVRFNPQLHKWVWEPSTRGV